jgi:methyl-accepting chemotaxis protein
MPILNARAHISRAYREIQHGMYQEASDDIRKAIDNLNKASLKSTESTQAGFEVVKTGLTEVGSISDASAEAKMVRLSNAARQLNTLIEQIRPTVVVIEEDGETLELLIDGQQ